LGASAETVTSTWFADAEVARRWNAFNVPETVLLSAVTKAQLA
jgi:hypothetical protein